MDKKGTRRHLPGGARAVLAGLICFAATGFVSAADPFTDAVGSSGFRLKVGESFDVRCENDGFDLGFEAVVGLQSAGSTDSPAPAQRDATIVPLDTLPDWRAQQAPSEDGAPENAVATEKEDRLPEKPFGWKQFKYDVRYVASKPAHLNGKEKGAVLAITGTTGLLYVYRKDIQDSWQESKTEKRSDFLSYARFMGGAGFAPLVALSAYVASFATDNDREKETAQLVLESWGLSAVGAGIGQFVLATERPEDGDAIHFFKPDGHGVSFDVAVAASIIPPLRRQYLRVRPGDTLGRKIIKHGLSALLYSGMVFTALQRIDANKHWAPDVFLGGVIGLGVGRTLGQAHDQAASERRTQFGISGLRGGVAVTLTVRLDPR